LIANISLSAKEYFVAGLVDTLIFGRGVVVVRVKEQKGKTWTVFI